ncbi:MAG: hypothetical protein ABIW34_10595 [Ginsengibacter sp.]
MNNIENFINKNREGFDSEEMKNGWEKFESKRKQKKIKSIRKYWWAAAAAVLIFVSGVIFYKNSTNKIEETAVQKPVELPSKELVDDVDPSYTFQMDQFVKLISLKQSELQQNQKKQPVLYLQFLKDNNQLDSSYNYLKSKLSSNTNKEILLDAIIQNLQLKLDLLNRQLQIIKQSKPAYRTGRNKKSDNEKSI